jgi:peptidoglycan/LPS O-acetylase OafA/YrhL
LQSSVAGSARIPNWNTKFVLPRHIPELDRLRGLAIILVLLRHSMSAMPAFAQRFAVQGWVGVDIFFVLSGFLITGILWDGRDQEKYFSRFYGHRVLRIWPVYLIMLSFVFLVIPLLKKVVGGSLMEIPRDPLGPWVYLLMIQNLFASSLSGSNFLRVTWSLAIEEQFYLVWPALIRILSRRAILLCFLTGVVSEPLIRVWAVHNGLTQAAIYENPLTHGDGLLCGAVVAVWLRCAKPKRSSLLFSGAALMIAGTCLFAPAFSIDASNQYAPALVFTGAAVASTGLLLVALVSENLGLVLRRTFFMNRTLAFFGFISYGLYLYHYVIFRFAGSERLAAKLDWLLSLDHAKQAMMILGIGLSVLIAWLSRITLEKAVLARKSMFG